jgi:hypothetical protein
MGSKTAATPEDPIVAIYPVPGEIDEREKDRLPPAPIRLERDRARKAVDSGAFSFEDPTQTEAALAAKAATGPGGDSKAVKAAEKERDKAIEAAAAKDAEIEELKAQLADAAKTPA